jgi:hypothetical protein
VTRRTVELRPNLLRCQESGCTVIWAKRTLPPLGETTTSVQWRSLIRAGALLAGCLFLRVRGPLR